MDRKLLQSEPRKRLDVLAAEQLSITRSAAQNLIADGNILVGGKPAAKSLLLNGNEVIEAFLPAITVDSTPKPQEIALDIVYEDDQLLVINKPKGLVVHPAPGNADSTLVNALLHHLGRDNLSDLNGEHRPGILHRLDKDTAGLLLVAKTNTAHELLASQIAAHSFLRQYEAIVTGGFKTDSGTIDKPIGRNPANRKKMAVIDQNSKPAKTHYRVLTQYQGYTHLELTLETGRTHQIRVHLSSIGHPVAGDTLYGDRQNRLKLDGQCLFARRIGFDHPNGEYMEFTAPLPDFFIRALQKLK